MSDPGGETIFDQLDQTFAKTGYRRTMGLHIVRAPADDPTASIVECEVSPEYANTQGVAHGGLISGLIDTAAGIAATIPSFATSRNISLRASRGSNLQNDRLRFLRFMRPPREARNVFAPLFKP